MRHKLTPCTGSLRKLKSGFYFNMDLTPGIKAIYAPENPSAVSIGSPVHGDWKPCGPRNAENEPARISQDPVDGF